MSTSKSFLHSLGFITALMVASSTNASALYNTNGGNNLNGTDGQLPPIWVGSATAPSYNSSMHVMWYADLANQTATLSTSDAIVNGAPANFLLGVGPKAWSNVLGHGLDYGLIHLMLLA
jgi:hypothetical protein